MSIEEMVDALAACGSVDVGGAGEETGPEGEEVDAVHERIMRDARAEIAGVLTRSGVSPSRGGLQLIEASLQCGINAAVSAILEAQEQAGGDGAP